MREVRPEYKVFILSNWRGGVGLKWKGGGLPHFKAGCVLSGDRADVQF